MYSQMFSEKSKTKIKSFASKFNDDIDDLDAINQEMNEFFGVEYACDKAEKIDIKSAKEFVDLVRSKNRFCLISKSTNPVYNLSLEDYIFRNTPMKKEEVNAKFLSERLLLYINDKTCVFGKNQNPFKELNLKSPLIKSNGGTYDLLRRYSGGGTVIHDVGNINYSFLTSRNEFDKKFYNTHIINLVNNYISVNTQLTNNSNIPLLELNERGDITCAGFKISGSAYKIAMNKSYHHGTMLIDSNLKEFSALMRPKLVENKRSNEEEKDEFSECNDVDSVRSKIANLKHLTKNVINDTNIVVDLLSKGFVSLFSQPKTKIYYVNSDLVNLQEVYTLDKENNKSNALSDLPSSDWIYSQTPSFKYTNKISGFHYKVKKGIIIESNDANKVKVNETRFNASFLI
ncbi:hypothetical protein QEN19_003458 [Hanseniaspora menglaensis]